MKQVCDLASEQVVVLAAGWELCDRRYDTLVGRTTYEIMIINPSSKAKIATEYKIRLTNILQNWLHLRCIRWAATSITSISMLAMVQYSGEARSGKLTNDRRRLWFIVWLIKAKCTVSLHQSHHVTSPAENHTVSGDMTWHFIQSRHCTSPWH